ncbi:MAG: hypothetical protein Q4C95_08240 [Planctomycetia bacterium]|nr:hypothetical protein [Planctomycetia bacterium]
MKFQNALPLFIAVLFLSFVGCGPKLPYEVVEFEGTLTYNGTPIPNVSFFFEPIEGRTSSGETDANGKFSMIYTADVDGVQTGKGHFYFISMPSMGGLAGETNADETNYQAVLSQKYPRGNSDLVVEITKAEKNYELKLSDE